MLGWRDLVTNRRLLLDSWGRSLGNLRNRRLLGCRDRSLGNLGRWKELLDSWDRSLDLCRWKELLDHWYRGLGNLGRGRLAPSRFTPTGWGNRAGRSLSAWSWQRNTVVSSCALSCAHTFHTATETVV